jgi:hypothetical protein
MVEIANLNQPLQVLSTYPDEADYSFVMAVRSQNIGDFLYALRCCLEDLGGVPEVLVTDNLKSAIVKASPYEPVDFDFYTTVGSGI